MHQQTEQIRMPPKSKPKTTKAAAKKKNNQQPPAPTSGIEAMMMRMHAKMVEVRLPPESSMRMFDILQRASEAGDRVSALMGMLGIHGGIFRKSRDTMSAWK